MKLHLPKLHQIGDWKSADLAKGIQRIFDAAPHAYLLLDRSFTITGVNRNYSKVTFTEPDQILGRYIFDVFPDNPGDPTAEGVKNLTASLDRVVRTKSPHAMRWQRYDIRNREARFLERYWAPINSPVLNKHGDVELLVHSIDDVTETMRNLDPSLKRAF